MVAKETKESAGALPQRGTEVRGSEMEVLLK
jgi:hypothetical protein